MPVTSKELRLSERVRNQAEIVVRDLDAVHDPERRARAIWSLIERSDLSDYYGAIRSASDSPGRAAADTPIESAPDPRRRAMYSPDRRQARAEARRRLEYEAGKDGR